LRRRHRHRHRQYHRHHHRHCLIVNNVASQTSSSPSLASARALDVVSQAAQCEGLLEDDGGPVPLGSQKSKPLREEEESA
jgi:hypothetical protein